MTPRQYSPERMNRRRHLHNILAGLIMAIPLYYLRDWSLFILIVLSGLIYFGFLYLINGIPFKGVDNLRKIKERS